MKKRYLVLEDKTVFEGYAFGADTPCVGELVFTWNVRLYGNPYGSELLWADCNADISYDRKLRNNRR